MTTEELKHTVTQRGTPLSVNLVQYFRDQRFDPRFHLGLGDIRLTIGDQDVLVQMVRELEERLEACE